MRSRFAAVFALLLLTLSGCRDDHEQVWKDHVQCLSDMHATLSGVTDEASAQAAAKALDAQLDQLEEIKQRAEGLGPIGKSDNEALEKKYKPQIDEISAHLRTRLETVVSNPQVEQHLKAARDRMAKLAGVTDMPAKKAKDDTAKTANPAGTPSGRSQQPIEPKLPGLE